jgi:hypothetical protein
MSALSHPPADRMLRGVDLKQVVFSYPAFPHFSYSRQVASPSPSTAPAWLVWTSLATHDNRSRRSAQMSRGHLPVRGDGDFTADVYGPIINSDAVPGSRRLRTIVGTGAVDAESAVETRNAKRKGHLGREADAY